MYLIILLIYAVCMCIVCFSQAMPIYYFDAMSLIFMILMIIPMYIASGLGKEFGKIFKLMFHSKAEFSRLEYRRMMESVNLLRRLNICGGIFTMVVGFISMLHRMDDPASLGPNVSVALTSIFYMVFICLILYPIQSKITTILMEE